jgi:hypothetical protein
LRDLLRHVGDVPFEGLEVGMQVDAIEKHGTFGGQSPTGQNVHQGGFAGAVGTDDAYEFGRADTQIGSTEGAVR